VRQSWDQGSLLKLIDVIGKTGRNWPIYAGKDQIRLISASVKAVGHSAEEPPTEEDSYTRSRGNSQNVTRDPHASLSLFAPREKTDPDTLPAVVPARASAKPQPRDYHDLFVGNESDQSPASPAKAPAARTPSPSKPAVVPTKVGAGKNYGPSRLFETNDSEQAPPAAEKVHSAEHFYRPNPAKYQHFEFADGSDPQDAPKPTPLKDVKKSKHGSQWNFDDFATPLKAVPTKVHRNDVVHWGTENDEVADSPIKQKQVLKPRKDAETNFEFQDDGTPEGGNRTTGRTRGAGQNTGLGLYKNNVYDEEDRGAVEGGDFKRLDTISNVKDRSKDFDPHFSMEDQDRGAVEGGKVKRLDTIANVKDRSKDFDPHFSMSDDSPASRPSAAEHLAADRAKAVKMMDANWSATYDDSPSQKENVPAAASKPNVGAGKGPLSESTNTVSKRVDNPKGITAGDGMGGTTGTGRDWGIGDDSDVDIGDNSRPGKYKAGRSHRGNQPSEGDFWNF
jgi:hypothetical protein